MLSLMMLMIGTGGSWVELPVQGRLGPIFVSRVRLTTFTSFPRIDGQSTDTPVLGVTDVLSARYSLCSVGSLQSLGKVDVLPAQYG